MKDMQPTKKTSNIKVAAVVKDFMYVSTENRARHSGSDSDSIRRRLRRNPLADSGFLYFDEDACLYVQQLPDKALMHYMEMIEMAALSNPEYLALCWVQPASL